MPLLEEKRSHCQKDRTAINVKKKLPFKDGSYANKYKTARELWAGILKTFGGNEATKKTKKNLLKQQYGNFRAEGSETLEQTFSRLQVIIGQLQFMDVEVKQNDLNQKFLTSLAPEWLMHTIVWRNRSDLDTMSLDDLYNHLKNLKTLKQEKEGVDEKLAGLLTASKDLDNLIVSQRPSPTVEITSEENQNKNPSISENVASPITPKPFIKVLVNKSHNKTPYELFNGRSPAIGFLKPFSCHVMILNTLDNLGKFKEKRDKGTNDTASQEVKKYLSSLRYIVLPNWAHDALLEFSSSKPQDHCSTEVPEGSGNTNPTTSTSNPSADHMETLTAESPIPTISLPVPTAYSTDSQDSSSDARLISKRVDNQEETPSLVNILSLTNWFEDILGGTTNLDESNGVEADVSNLEKTITASPTLTLRIHKDHPKSQIIGLVDTPIQTRNKSKEVGEQSFIATIHQKTDPALL
nr:hypothetical protein [Tanacetum cinerariifolium]